MKYRNIIELTQMWIKGYEGCRLKAYKDSLGKSTIGFGHLNTEGYTEITLEKAEELFQQDWNDHVKYAKTIPEYKDLDVVRKMALINITYNMGANDFINGFPTCRKNMRNKNWEGVYRELLCGSNPNIKSLYYKQVGSRAKEVAQVLLSGDINDIKPRPINWYGNKPKEATDNIAKTEFNPIKTKTKEIIINDGNIEKIIIIYKG